MPDTSDDCACVPMVDPTANRILAATNTDATQMVRIFLVLHFINDLDLCIGLKLFPKVVEHISDAS
jgi:hypothetical protein